MFDQTLQANFKFMVLFDLELYYKNPCGTVELQRYKVPCPCIRDQFLYYYNLLLNANNLLLWGNSSSVSQQDFLCFLPIKGSVAGCDSLLGVSVFFGILCYS